MFNINNVPALGQALMRAAALDVQARGWTPLTNYIAATAGRIDERVRRRKAAIAATKSAKAAR